MDEFSRKGLKSQYEVTDSPTVRNWVRQLISFTMLPVFVIPIVWNWLKYPPATGNTVTDAKLLEIAAYFEHTWIAGEFPPSLWSRYDNTRPRTTNHAEGFHSSLNTRFGLPHPSLLVFLDWLQKL